MGDFGTITSADLESTLSLEDLTAVLIDIITEIRKNDNYGSELRLEIDKLNKYADKISNSTSLEDLFNAYENIQSISMYLRKLLSQFINLEVYDKITYSFYYNGKRYETDNIDASWLTKSSKGELKLKLYEAEKTLQEEASDEYKEQVNHIFNRHYAIFLQAISGTYNGIIGRSGALNMGHIAEAYEEHISEHHPKEYRVLNNLAKSGNSLTVLDKMMLNFESDVDAVTYWDAHEGITNAWMHIRNSLGTQRGTVAGDVGQMQVKQGKTGAGRIRLARLNTLKEGIDAYCAIVSNEPVKDVALRIAKYISEPVRQTSSKIIDNIKDEKIRELLNEDNFKRAENIMVHI